MDDCNTREMIQCAKSVKKSNFFPKQMKKEKSTTLHILLCFVMTSHMYAIFLLNITSFVINCSTMRNFLDESLDLTKHRAERYSSVNKTVREIEKKIGHTSQLSFSGENTNYGDSFLLVCPLSEK